jgi:peptidoglycan/LPS O-acetylase OafA/YrhL
VKLILDRLMYLPPLRIWEFVIGCALGLSFLQGRQATAAGWSRALESVRVRNTVVAAVLIAAVALQFVPTCLAWPCGPGVGTPLALLNVKGYVAYTPLATLLVAALAWGRTFLTRPLENSRVRLLGEASYSLYIVQWIPWLLLYGAWLEGAPPPWWLVALTVAGTVLISLASFRFLETPLRRWFRRSRSPQASLASAHPGAADD